jgi:hypothetical protein
VVDVEPPPAEGDPPVPITPPVARVPPLPDTPLSKACPPRGLEEQAKTRAMRRVSCFIICLFPAKGSEVCVGYDARAAWAPATLPPCLRKDPSRAKLRHNTALDGHK